jgi:cell wall integrity and stress response component
MVLIRFVSALAAASMLLTAAADDTPTTTIKNHITTPTVTLPASAMVEIGCFETGTPLENHGEYEYRSPGNCQLVCLQENKNVMAMSDGINCWCGDKIPAKAWQVSNSTCDTSCSGDKTVRCGGPDRLWVVLTGNTRNRVDYFDPKSSSSSSAKSTAPETSAAPAVTATSTPSAAPQKEESKPNTAGIAAGVVVGIVGLGAIIGGVWFFMRRRRQKQAEEDYRRNAANVDSFVSGGKLHTSNSSMNDSRIDPSFMDRRQSNGSIADNEDYSRRILKVTNV